MAWSGALTLLNLFLILITFKLIEITTKKKKANSGPDTNSSQVPMETIRILNVFHIVS